MNDLIEKISLQLKEQYSNVNFRIDNKDELIIQPINDDGFEIFIQQGDRENTVHFGGWHFHFDNDKKGTNDLLDYLGFGMSKLGRLKVYSKNANEYKWTFETKNEEDGKWYSTGTMGLMNLKFWQKPEIKYYQNNLIDLSEMEKQ